MKTFLISCLLLLCSLSGLRAQQLLPVSSQSEAAQADYVQALQAAEHANIPDYLDGLKAAVEKDPTFFMAYTYLAMSETAFGQYEKAADYIQTALAIDAAGLNEGENILRQALLALQADPKANLATYVADLTAAYPQTAQAFELAAVTASWINQDPQAAIRYNLRLLELRPGSGGVYNSLGYNYMAIEDMAQAKAAFEKYLELAPDEANAYDSMGEYYMVTKDYANSLKYYEQAVAKGMSSAKQRADQAREALAKQGN